MKKPIFFPIALILSTIIIAISIVLFYLLFSIILKENYIFNFKDELIPVLALIIMPLLLLYFYLHLFLKSLNLIILCDDFVLYINILLIWKFKKISYKNILQSKIYNKKQGRLDYSELNITTKTESITLLSGNYFYFSRFKYFIDSKKIVYE